MGNRKFKVLNAKINGTSSVESFDVYDQSALHTGVQFDPIYIGDYYCPPDYLPSAVVRIGDYFYTFDAPMESYALANQTNVGKLRKFDIVNNVEITADAKDLEMGHANSVAYDYVNNRVYIAPIFDYSSGTRTGAKYLYSYPTDFSSVTRISIPTTPTNMSYDPVRKKLYYKDFSHDVYEVNGATSTLYTRIDITGLDEHIAIANRTFNQDFAVYDGDFYMSSPAGNVIMGHLEPGTSKPSNFGNVSYQDSLGIFYMGELEGWEFNADGHLYALKYTEVPAKYMNAFVTEIPAGHAKQTSTGLRKGYYMVSNYTLTYLGVNSNVFAMDTTQIRSLSQLNVVKYGYGRRLTVAKGTNVEDIIGYVNQDTNILLAGSLKLPKFVVYNSKLSITCNSASNKLTFTDDDYGDGDGGFVLRRGGELLFAGDTAINVYTPSGTGNYNFIQIGNDYSITYCRVVPVSKTGRALYIGARELTAAGVYVGQTNILFASNKDVYTYTSTGTDFAGHITSESKDILFTIPFNVDVTYVNGINITSGKVTLRGVNGYLKGTTLETATVDLANPSGFTVTISKGHRCIIVKLSFSSAIANATNNTPVVVTVSGNFVIEFT